jgi:hypothetical protein
MEILDTYIRNLYVNIYAPSFVAARPPACLSHFYMLRGNAYNFVRTNRIFQVWYQTKGNIAVYMMKPVTKMRDSQKVKIYGNAVLANKHQAYSKELIINTKVTRAAHFGKSRKVHKSNKLT